ASGKSPLHMVSAWGCGQRLVLAQIATDVKSNEITAVPKLLEMLTLKGTIVTVDALNCQRDIAQQIVDQGGDYVLALKGNQDTLHDDVVGFGGSANWRYSGARKASARPGRVHERPATTDSSGWPLFAAPSYLRLLRRRRQFTHRDHAGRLAHPCPRIRNAGRRGHSAVSQPGRHRHRQAMRLAREGPGMAARGLSLRHRESGQRSGPPPHRAS
ncbi:MAG TPA: ISAs1 family transposase, partial [Acetobacteraceae bacterium]|nr:ISAs1 family transposase [Acetobacteraceae bacterium]